MGRGETAETLKVNQSQNVYVERSNVSGAGDNAIDFVAVQHGHLLANRIHHAGDWCAYAKGGSADIRVAGNEIYACGTGGFTAGQGTGLQFMTPPWIQFEAYDVTVLDNFVMVMDFTNPHGACSKMRAGVRVGERARSTRKESHHGC